MKLNVGRHQVSLALLAALAGCATPAVDIPHGAAVAEATWVATPSTASWEPAPPRYGEQPTDGVQAAASKQPAVTQDSGAFAAGPGVMARGLASWYGRKFHGRRTASGERYDRHAFTAAHRTLPFGTRVRVRSVVTGKEVVVRINDRGPFKRSRVIDLSQTAFNALGLQGRGVTQVELLPE